MSDGQPMDTAPKDRPILAWCDHKADPYVEDRETGRLTTYAAHAEGLSVAPDGFSVVEWGGQLDEDDYDSGQYLYIPPWWFVVGSEFEVVANPTMWWELPKEPANG